MLKLLFHGVKFVIRKLKQALYTNVGMVVDAILVATGIGKAAPFVVWALIVALDIYEMSSGDYSPEKKEMTKLQLFIDLGVDILSMVFTGAVGKSTRVFFQGLFSFIKTGRSQHAD